MDVVHDLSRPDVNGVPPKMKHVEEIQYADEDSPPSCEGG